MLTFTYVAHQETQHSIPRWPNPVGGNLDGPGGIVVDRSIGGDGQREGVVVATMKSVARAIASEAGRRIIRGVLGSILGGKR